MVRAHQRLEPLENYDPERTDPSPAEVVGNANDAGPDRSRLATLFRQVLEAALAALDSPDRLRLGYYYVQQLTLAEIGRLLGEHEATVSRKLARTRKQLRHAVENALRDQHRLTPAEIALSYQYVVDETPLDLREMLEP